MMFNVKNVIRDMACSRITGVIYNMKMVNKLSNG